MKSFDGVSRFRSTSPRWSITVLLAVLVSAWAASAQQSNIVSQTVLVDVTSDELAIDASITVEFNRQTAGFSVLDPGADATFLVDGVETTSHDHPQYGAAVQVIDLPGGVEAGETAEISMLLRGDLDCGLPNGTVVCTHLPSETILTGATVGAGWYFINVFEDDSFDVTLNVVSPETYTVRAPQGPPTSTNVGGGEKTTTFVLSYPPQITLYAGVADEVVGAGPTPVRGAFHDDGGNREKMQRAVDIAAANIAYYEEAFGALPFSEAALTTTPADFAFGGLGAYGNVFVGEYIIGNPAFEYLLEVGVAHEFAHSWWGGMTQATLLDEGGALQEGLAEYSAWRALGDYYDDPRVRDAGMRTNAVWYLLGRPSDEDIAPFAPGVQQSPLYTFVAYHKASLVYRMLETAVGIEDFTAALAEVAQQGTGALTSGALVNALDARGHDVSPIVNDFMHAPGFPTLSTSSDYRDGQLTIDVSSDVAKRFVLPVQITFSDGTTQTHAVQMGGPRARLSLDHPSPPALVEVDAQWTAVRLLAPAVRGDVTWDGIVDAHDLLEVSLRNGGAMPTSRRVDGHYDPLYDVDQNGAIDEADQQIIIDATPG